MLRTLFSLVFLGILKLNAQPVITSFAPASGSVGTMVTITGGGFNPVAANNHVWFGPVEAIVGSVSATSISVVVPAGAAFHPITVAANGYSATSTTYFNVTFAGGGNGFVAGSFAPKTDFDPGGGPRSVSSSDFDGDGLPDLVVSNGNENSITIHRNNSTGSNISFQSKVTLATGGTPRFEAVADIDGDNSPDIVVPNFGTNTISVFRNTSVAGSVSFASKIDFATGTAPSAAAIADIDGDGKQDVLVVNNISRTISVFPNNSTAGNINFGTRVDLPTAVGPWGITVGDIDSDGKLDIAVANSNSGAGNTISIFRNTSVPGAISVAPKIDLTTGTSPRYIAIGDLNADGKHDVVSVNAVSNTISVFRNTGTVGAPAFAAKTDYATGGSPQQVLIADLDGNGKPDLAVDNSGSSNSVSVYNNTSTAGGSILLAGKVDYATSSSPTGITIADFNLDGRPDIAAAAFLSQKVSVLKNMVNQPNITSFTPTTGGAGTTITLHGHNFTGATAVAFGGVPAASFSVVNANQITAVAGAGSSGSVSVTTIYGTGSLAGYTHVGPPLISSFSPQSAGPGSIITINGINLNNATKVMFGAVPAVEYTIVSSTEIRAMVGDGDANGFVSVSTPYGADTLPGFEFIPKPIISGFAPDTGRIGTLVTITGSNFGAAIADNIVRFGSINAIITNASTTSLTVIVPPGADFSLISITTKGRTAFSASQFSVTFAGGGAPFSASTFTKVQENRSVKGQQSIRSGDLDGDGKNDLVTVDENKQQLVVYRNRTTNDSLLFEDAKSFNTTLSPSITHLADVDGDGKTDVIISTLYPTVSVFNNTSSPGDISFAPRIDVPVALAASHISFGDIDGDGREDFVYTNGYVDSLLFYRNTSENGIISFVLAGKVLHKGARPAHIAIADLDGDGKPDLATSNYDSSTVSLYRNISSVGKIQMAPVIQKPAGVNPIGIVAAKLNDDEAVDLLIANSGGANVGPMNTVSAYKNTSTSGNITVGTHQQYQVAWSAVNIAVADIDGDGKPDYGVPNFYGNAMSLGRNNSGQEISFEPWTEYKYFNKGRALVFSDFNNDGRPDIAFLNQETNTIDLLRNRVGEPVIITLCPPTASATLQAGSTGTSYQWQADTGTGYFDIIDNVNFTGTQASSLQLNNIPSSWYNRAFRAVVDGTPTQGYIVRFGNVFVRTVNDSWENAANWSCGTLPDKNTDVIVERGTPRIAENTSIRSLNIRPELRVNVSFNKTLTITH